MNHFSLSGHLQSQEENLKFYANCFATLTRALVADHRDNKPPYVNEKSRKSKVAEIGRKAEFRNYLN